MNKNWEKKDNHLISYIDDEYNVNYLEKYDQIKNFLKLTSAESMSYIYSVKKENHLDKKVTLKILKENIIDILELKKIKYIIRYNILNKKHTKYDLDLFFLIIEKMNLEAKRHNSNYIFVYVPDSARYISFPETPIFKETMDLKEELLKSINEINITVVDLTDFFDAAKNVEQYFPLGYIGHFNANGYKKISEIIASKLN